MSKDSQADEWEIVHYFDYSDAGIDVEEEGLSEMKFGEYLVENGKLSREQLFRALMEQDKCPETPIGVVLVALGFIPLGIMNHMLREFHQVPVVEVP